MVCNLLCKKQGVGIERGMGEVHRDKTFIVCQISFDSSEVKMLPMTSEGSTVNRNEGVELWAAHGHLLTCPDEKLLPKSIGCFGTNEKAATMPVRQDGSCAWPHLMHTLARCH